MNVQDKKRLKRTICLKDEIEDYVKHLGLDEKMQELRMLSLWQECVGDSISRYSKPQYIKQKKLFVSVENAAWRYELSIRKEEIISRLNESLKKINKHTAIKEIVFI